MRRSSGGVPARRAVIRWARRTFRREWRQQVLVIALLTLAVAIAVGGASAAFNSARPTEFEFGTADHRLTSELSEESDPLVLDAYLTAAEEWFGGIDVIRGEFVGVPGSTEELELRAQDPEGRFGGPMLGLRDGRYPARAGEAAVTDRVAETFQLRMGDALTLDDRDWTIVGLVENPTNLDDEFALVTSDSQPDLVSVLVDASEERVESFPATRDPGPGFVDSRGSTADRGAAGAGALAASTVVLLLVCLIGAASFVVVAQRRLRQLGMLAAMGATHKHLRLVVVANGAAVGAVAAVLGALLGLSGWVVLAPRLETVAVHRIDRFNVPWLLVGAGMLLAVAAASLAAWWPARTMARVPVTRALSGRPPRPRPARRSVVLAVPLLAGGVVALTVGIDTVRDEANPALLIAGVIAIPLGIVLLSPLAIRTLAPMATRLPVSARLALRDLARYQARSGAALAAISLGLGITATIVVAAAAAEDSADEGNLSDRQLLFRTDEADEGGFVPTIAERTPAELDSFASTVDRVAASLDGASVVALDVPVDSAFDDRNGEVSQSPVVLSRRLNENTARDLGPVYVATPEALAHIGLDTTSLELDSRAELLTPETGALLFTGGVGGHVPIQGIETIDAPSYTAAPRSFITPDGLRQHGWESARAAWLVEASEPLTADERDDARSIAADAGLTVEARRGQEGLTTLRSGATAVGVLLGLAILAMTVGLIRSEAAGDLRTLAATGASARVRRSITGATAGALAFLGALLGTGGAYAALAAGYSADLGQLTPVPLLELVVISVGLPLVAAAAAWLFAGRQPPALARTPIE